VLKKNVLIFWSAFLSSIMDFAAILIVLWHNFFSVTQQQQTLPQKKESNQLFKIAVNTAFHLVFINFCQKLLPANLP
jgi:hypothetical protein